MNDIESQNQLQEYFNYLIWYIEEAMFTSYPDLYRYHLLQTHQVLGKQEWSKFKAAFGAITNKISSEGRDILYKQIKKDLCPYIESYVAFYDSNYNTIRATFDRRIVDKEESKLAKKVIFKKPLIDTNVKNPIQGGAAFGMVDPFSNDENPFTILLYYCNETLKEIEILNPKDSIKGHTPRKNNIDNLKIPIPVIALKYQYLRLAGEHEGITLENRDEIASDYDWNSSTSGKQLHDDFKKNHTEEERMYPTIGKNEYNYLQAKAKKIKKIEMAVELLANNSIALEIAKKELEKANK